MKKKHYYLPDIVGKGYRTFWNFKGRYRICKGSRASKKSKTTALWIIYNMQRYKEANALVIRKTFRTLKDSCWTDLKWAVHRLGTDYLWQFTLSPLEATYLPTGQKILFRGLDDPLKVTSITVGTGVLCWMWIEEAYEIMSEEDFDMLDESIRGECPAGLWKQITLTFNPWNERHWIKSRFFDVKDDPEILAITTNYMCNEWLDEADLQVFERMKVNNPRRYKVAGLGGWGIVEGVVYDNWTEETFTIEQIRKEHPSLKTCTGLDFGYTNDPSAYIVCYLDLQSKDLFVYDEIYQTGLSNQRIAGLIKRSGYGKEKITADSAEPKSIDELHNVHNLRIKGAKKGKDSIKNGIQWIQDLKIHVHPRCVNFVTEISNYTWDTDKFGKRLNVPIDDFNHLMDAMRYALEDYITGSAWIY